MPFHKGHTYWDNPKTKATQFKKGQTSPRKGKKSNKPAWNKGTKGLMKSNKTSYKRGENAKEKHPMWKGGISKIDKIVRRMPEYLHWRDEVFKRDNWSCRKCGITKVYVTAHHIKSFSLILKENNVQSVDDARRCLEIWELENGMTLCENCHKVTDNYKGRACRKVKNGANSVKLSQETIPSQQER